MLGAEDGGLWSEVLHLALLGLELHLVGGLGLVVGVWRLLGSELLLKPDELQDVVKV